MLDINRWLLKVSGIWCILNQGNNKWKNITHTVCVILMCQLIFLPAEFLKLITSYQNFKSTMEQLGLVIIHTVTTAKILNLYLNRTEISAIFDELVYHENPTLYKNLQEKFNGKIYRVCMFFFQMGNGTAGILCLISLIHLAICKSDGNWQEFCTTVQPIVIYIPIPINAITYSRWILCAFQCICLTLYGWQIVAHDSLFIAILVEIDCKVHILQLKFRNIAFESNNITCEMNFKMYRITSELQDLIRTCQRTCNVFQYIILLQVLSSLFILITCLYVAASVPVFGGTFIFQLQFYLTLVTQLSMYCWFANEVTISLSHMPESIYESGWVLGDQRFKRAMLINIIRMSKPIHFTIGTIAPLNLNVLVYILRASYTYFAIIKNK